MSYFGKNTDVSLYKSPRIGCFQERSASCTGCESGGRTGRESFTLISMLTPDAATRARAAPCRCPGRPFCLGGNLERSGGRTREEAGVTKDPLLTVLEFRRMVFPSSLYYLLPSPCPSSLWPPTSFSRSSQGPRFDCQRQSHCLPTRGSLCVPGTWAVHFVSHSCDPPHENKGLVRWGPSVWSSWLAIFSFTAHSHWLLATLL